MNKYLATRLSRHTNADYMFHYMDSVQRTTRRDPLLKSSRAKGSKYGWFTTMLIALSAIALVLSNV